MYNWCSYFDSFSRKFVIPIPPSILEIFDPRSFSVPDFDMRLQKSATSLYGIDLFVFSASLAFLLTDWHFACFITHESTALRHVKVVLTTW